jgi:hypothetical protein
VADALFEPDAVDIDVDGLHQGYLRSFKSKGGPAGWKRAGDRNRGLRGGMARDDDSRHLRRSEGR